MASQTYLTKRNGVFYCRISIPVKYRNRMGKCEHWKSLGTSSYYEAIIKLSQEAGRLHMLMQGKELKIRKLQDSDIPFIAEQHYKVTMVAHETHYLLTRPAFAKDVWLNEMDADFVAGNKQKIEAFELALNQGNYEAGKKLVSERLFPIHEVNIKCSDKSIAYKHLCFAAMHAHIRALQDINKRMEQGWNTVPYYAGTITPLSEQLELIPTTTHSQFIAETACIATLGELIKGYNDDNINKRKTKAIIKRNQGFQSVLLDLLGADLQLNNLSKKVANEFFGSVTLIPVNFNKKSKGLSIKKYLEKYPDHKEPTLKPLTVRGYMSHYS